MPIRRQTLEEWFLVHQLRHAARRHFHLPLFVEADVTALARAWGASPPWSAVLVKALALTARAHPSINRAVFRTFWGTRVVELEGDRRVNLPVLVTDDAGREHLSATVVERADERPIAEIREALRAARARRPADLPIGRLFVANRNTFLNRLRLRLIHFLVYNLPQLYVRKGGGGLSVSSLLYLAEPGFRGWAMSYGPTAFTAIAISVTGEPDGRTVMRVGVGYDHFALPGHEALDALRTLSRILAASDPADLAALSDSPPPPPAR
jgi:hypothetical protein